MGVVRLVRSIQVFRTKLRVLFIGIIFTPLELVHSTGNPWVTQAVPALNPYPCSWVRVPAGMTHGYVKFSCCSLIGEWRYFCTKISHLLLKIYMKIHPQIMNWWMAGFLHKNLTFVTEIIMKFIRRSSIDEWRFFCIKNLTSILALYIILLPAWPMARVWVWGGCLKLDPYPYPPNPYPGTRVGLRTRAMHYSRALSQSNSRVERVATRQNSPDRVWSSWPTRLASLDSTATLMMATVISSGV